MKYLPSITVLLWISIVMVYIYANDIFILPVIKFPSFILLSIFLPVSFWTLQTKNKPLHASVFIGIFIFNISILVFGLVTNYSTLESLLENTEKRIDPELAKLLVSGDTEKERRFVGRIIFQKHGVALPFKTNDDLYALFAPTKKDKDIFLDINEKNYLILLAKQNLSHQIVTTFFLLALHVVIFFILLIYLILYDRPPPPILQKQ